MGLPDILDRMPFNDELGINLIEAKDGHAVGTLELTAKHSSNPNTMIAHGGVTYALADTVAGAAAASANDSLTPTIDMRIDFLAPATGGTLQAEAEVIRNGNNVASVEVDITNDERDIATARGTFKTSGGDETSAWYRSGIDEY